MAAIFVTTDHGLKRTTGLLSASGNYTATWWAYIPSWPSTGEVRTLYMVANSADRTDESIVVAQDETGEIYLVVAGVRKTGAIFAPGWHSLALLWWSSSNSISLFIDSPGAGVSSATVTFGAWTFNEIYLGTDPRIPTDGLPQQVAYFREWPSAIGVTYEWRSPTPVRTSDLYTDSPFHSDLLDLTVNNNDWTQIGATSTLTSLGGTLEGIAGGWWSLSTVSIVTGAHEGILLIRAVTGLGGSGVQIARVAIQPTGFTYSGPEDSYTIVNYEVRLAYINAGGTETILTSTNPITDPAQGRSAAGVLAPRGTWHIPWRFALAFKCSTYNRSTLTYSADGYVKLYMNGTILLEAVDIVIPHSPYTRGNAVEYKYGMRGDFDRAWARAVPDLPPTNDQGAFTSGTPTSLVYFDDFDDVDITPTNWTVNNVSSVGGGAMHPTAYNNCGGDDGAGLSAYSKDPTGVPYGGSMDPGLSWSAIYRALYFPPYDPSLESSTPPGEGEEEPPPEEEDPTDNSGVYFVYPGKITKSDSYYNRDPEDPAGTIELKIPNPTIRTALLGE